MNRRQLNQTIDYALITTILVVFFFSVLIFRFTAVAIKIVALVSALAYVIWGVTHHTKSGHIDQKILLEYVGIAALGIVIVFLLI